MGTLVQFDVRRRRPAAPKQGPFEAKVLIFTGVRYERAAAAMPATRPDPVKPGRRRV